MLRSSKTHLQYTITLQSLNIYTRMDQNAFPALPHMRYWDLVTAGTLNICLGRSEFARSTTATSR